MDLEAMDDAVPEAPAPRSKVYVRERFKPHGWANPPGNLVEVYLTACERHKVSANSAVIAQLQRRVRLMQPGPWQRVVPTEPPALRPPQPASETTLPSPGTATPPRTCVSPATAATRPNNKRPGPSPNASFGPSPSHSHSHLPSFSHSYTPSYSQTPSQILSAMSSHTAVAAATQTSQELRDLIMGHVYPLTLGPTLRPEPAASAAGASAFATAAGGRRAAAAAVAAAAGAGGGGGDAAAGGSQNHKETVMAAAIALAVGAPGSQMYSARAVGHVCQLVDPRTPWEQQLAGAGLRPDVRVVTEAEFGRLLEAAAAAASLGELRQAALEVLSRPVGHGTLDVEGLAGALFDYLDVSVQGTLPASELRSAVGAFSPVAAADLYGLMERFPAMARMNSDQVTRSEFVEVLVALAPGLAPPGSSPALVRDKTEIAINAMLDSKIREPYGYDFSRCYLGPRGLLPVLDALGCDSAFAHLSLANCGLGCSAVERLADWLQGHPALTSLDLTNNVIADRGGLALSRLLEANPRLVQLGIGSTYLLPPRPGRLHHDNLGPSPCEDAGPLLEALATNRAARRSSPAEIVGALRQHGPELRAMCYSLLARDGSNSNSHGRPPSRCSTPPGGPPDGRVPLGALREALGEVTAEWGFTADALDEVLHHERLLGTATAGRTADESGRLGVTYDELMQFLRSEDQVLRVATAFRNHLLEAKRLFFALAPEPATAASISAAGVAGPRTALSTVRRAIVAAASQPGSGWDVSEADLEAVLSPAFLRAHCRASAAGATRPAALGGGGGGQQPAERPDGLLVPEWAAAGDGGSAVSVSSAVQQQAASDMLISWPELANTLLYLFNR
ncbi:hypothetical protein PLESTB_001015100 [Pleodorina starrii]|uniref:Uncharacterized protein n=1 Tax=Pleodorina starrii TaxID=330485 RepID=A0A9W6BNU5_9CHLO|nr:hypothetical protein PLESTM_001192200 [Pleodorina starrii]GLC55691.1 hypothetical protein PLESTB_001015100 [Pleodorina starrii]GLC65441.1 hypothetical protein PLESTF_000293600 [Pleodorina starrii]